MREANIPDTTGHRIHHYAICDENGVVLKVMQIDLDHPTHYHRDGSVSFEPYTHEHLADYEKMRPHREDMAKIYDKTPDDIHHFYAGTPDNPLCGIGHYTPDGGKTWAKLDEEA